MASDTEPSNAIKLLHLFVLSTSWGMQVWVTFVAGFVMSRHLPRHTFGSIQRELFPYYFHISSTCAFLSLTLFAMSHPSEQLSQEHKTQVYSPFLTHSPNPFLCSSGWLANCGDPYTVKRSPQAPKLQQARGPGGEI
uniref:TMEM205-like domain-containing protein n=1 Tax=Zonotrichia albicollis TaxID=44394 RepID=A0A8D2M5R1_ZONAL